MIVMIGGEKGGTGKTTLATALAVLAAQDGRDVLLVDTDKQGSASSWAAMRDDAGAVPRIPTVAKYGRGLPADLRDLAGRCELVIVDAGGRDSLELRGGLAVAQRLYVPITPGQFDVWTLQTMAELVEQAQALNPALAGWVVINRANPNPVVSEAGDAWEGAGDCGLGVANTVLHDRITHRYAVRAGLCAVEYKPQDRKASAELRRLYAECIGAAARKESA
jgi:chromosome partitioning protein